MIELPGERPDEMPRPTERSGPLIGHVRRGRLYQTPLTASGILTVGDWIRDDLPDLLWPALYLAALGTTSAAVDFVRFQNDVLDDLSGTDEGLEASFLTDCLDGRLTGLDRLVERSPEADAVIIRRSGERGLLPEAVAKALATYPDRPAPWLVDRPVTPPDGDDVNLLAKAVREAVVDGHREAVLKCLQIWAGIQGGTFSSDAHMVELLRHYPNDADMRSQADSLVRSSWGARRGRDLMLHPEYEEASATWAKVFWDVNSLFTACIRKREVPTDAGDDAAGADGEAVPLELDDVVDAESGASWLRDQPETATLTPQDLRRQAMDLMTSYVEALETAPMRLYDPNPQEVHSGIVSRAAREVITALGAPDLWCTEHGPTSAGPSWKAASFSRGCQHKTPTSTASTESTAPARPSSTRSSRRRSRPSGSSTRPARRSKRCDV